MATGVYRNAENRMATGHINLTADALKYALFTNAYTPNFDTDTTYAGISANEVSGTGYTAGGATVSGASITQIAANSWGATWTASTAYQLGQVVKPATPNGFIYMCVVAGTTGVSAPSFPTTKNLTVVDSGVTWLCVGTSALKFTITAPSWASSSITAYKGVLYDTTDANNLICCQDFIGAPITSTNGTFTATPDANNGLFIIY